MPQQSNNRLLGDACEAALKRRSVNTETLGSEQIKNLGALALLALTCACGSASARDHPACVGKDNDACDTFASLIVLKGKGCFRLMDVQSLGNDAYRLTCELASYDRSRVTYTLRFADGRRSYTVR
jgi:hypothetical protein